MSKKKSKQQRIESIAKAMGGKVGEPIDGVLSGPIGAARLAAKPWQAYRQTEQP